MATTKRKKATKTQAKKKIRSSKVSVRDLDAGKGKSVAGGQATGMIGGSGVIGVVKKTI